MNAIRVPILRWVPPDRKSGDEVAYGWLLFLRPFSTRAAALKVAREECGNVWPSGPVHDVERQWAVVVPAVGLPGDSPRALAAGVRRDVARRAAYGQSPYIDPATLSVVPAKQNTLFD